MKKFQPVSKELLKYVKTKMKKYVVSIAKTISYTSIIFFLYSFSYNSKNNN